MKKIRRILLGLLAGLLVTCLAVSLISYLSNRNLPAAPDKLDLLSELDKARLAEALQLKESFGQQVWPGLGKANIPILLWNREYSFLVGFGESPPGWEPVEGDDFLGETYYRQRSADTQNFAVEVGGRWVASIGSKWEADAFMMEMFEQMLPPVLEDIFPYRLLILPSEVQITGVLHESFHVYQAQMAPERLRAAEASHGHGERYWQADEAMRADWSEEIRLLRRALEAGSEAETVGLVREFMEMRERRRAAHSLSGELIDFEREFEWEEGLAKYVELEFWRLAFEAGDYQPVVGMDADPDFKGYRTYEQRWSQELGQMERDARRSEDTRFYYTGMAQAVLLDRLLPGWKGRVFEEGVWLDTILGEAVAQ